MRSVGRTVLIALFVALAIALMALFCILRMLPPTTRQTDATPYTIGVWDGYVAVFEGEDSYPMQVLDTAVAGLPEEQRAQVERGVRVARAEELYLMLEDYTG